MKLLFFGDSITDAARNRDEAACGCERYGVGFVRQIAGTLLYEAPWSYEIVNRGISGNRVVDLYARVEEDVWNEKPDVVNILVGINDIWHKLDWNRGVDLERFERVYAQMVEETRQRLPEAVLILDEPFVLRGSQTKENYEGFLEVREYAKAVRRIAERSGALFLPLQEKMDQAARKFSPERILLDGVHPDIAGAVLMANAWLELFYREVVGRAAEGNAER